MRFELQRASIRWFDYENKNNEDIVELWDLPKNFNISFTFDGRDTEVFIEINSLEELMNFEEAVGHDLIISEDRIVIYDDYVE